MDTDPFARLQPTPVLVQFNGFEAEEHHRGDDKETDEYREAHCCDRRIGVVHEFAHFGTELEEWRVEVEVMELEECRVEVEIVK